MNKNKISNVDTFINSINAESASVREKTEAEMVAYHDSELAAAKAAYTERAERYKRREIAKAENELSSEISARHINARVELIKRRAVITDSIIQAAKERLIAYTDTEEYRLSLLKSAEMLSRHLLSNRVTLYVRPLDMMFAKEIVKAYGSFCRVDVDTKILIGGIRGYDKILQKVVDDTLDEKLATQREWFTQNSKLTISIR